MYSNKAFILEKIIKIIEIINNQKLEIEKSKLKTKKSKSKNEGKKKKKIKIKMKIKIKTKNKNKKQQHLEDLSTAGIPSKKQYQI